MTELFFDIAGIPSELEPRPTVRREPTSLEELERIIRRNDRAIFPVVGDCLEGVDVVDGGWIGVDFTRFPAPPRYKSKGGDGSEDVCLCCGVFPGQRRPTVMCKSYIGMWGPWHMVGTRYSLAKRKNPLNCAMQATKIFGVVFASWDADRRLLWKRDPSSFPDSLGSAPTIHGGNVGDPIPLEEAAICGC